MKDIYKIEWRDSRRYLYQMDSKESFSVCTVITVGHLIEEDKEQITLSQDLIDEEIRGVICIPKENIVSKKMLFLN